MESESWNWENKRVLLSDVDSMPGKYLTEEMRNLSAKSFHLKENGEIAGEDSKVPDGFELVVFSGYATDDRDAEDKIYRRTLTLLEQIKGMNPKAFVFLSSTEVYGKHEGEEIDESCNTWTNNEIGRAYYRAEEAVKEHFAGGDTKVTILRCAPMFGDGMTGFYNDLFQRVVRGAYVHVRGNDARRSIVLAYDVARLVGRIVNLSGIYNVSDGKGRRLIELVEGMSANTGMNKRMIYLPQKWAGIMSKVADYFPGLRMMMGKDVLRRNSMTLTYSTEKLKSAIDFDFHDTVEVVARREKRYPYKED